jgi:uncharacterized protein
MKKSIRNAQTAAMCSLLMAIVFSSRAYAEQNGAKASAQEQFFAAIQAGDVDRVKKLLKENPSFAKSSNEKGTTATLFAVYTQHKDIAELLLASGAEPNIFEAAATGHVERVRQLLKDNPGLGHDYSADGWTALHLNFGNLAVVKLLLDSGADINAVSKNKFTATPLQGAVVMKNLDLCRLLLERGASVSPRGEEGTTPLHEAAGSGQMDFVKLLLEHGAEVNAKDDAGKTPLGIALEHKQPEIATVLREHGGVQ